MWSRGALKSMFLTRVHDVNPPPLMVGEAVVAPPVRWKTVNNTNRLAPGAMAEVTSDVLSAVVPVEARSVGVMAN